MTSLLSTSSAQFSSPRLPFLFFLLVCLWMMTGMIGHDPWKPDEAYTFGLILSMLQDHEWVVPTLAGEAFLEKPPLFFWVAAWCAQGFSFILPLHDGARLASVFFLILTFIGLHFAEKALSNNSSRGKAILLFMGMLGPWIRCHQLITDIGLLASTTWIVWGILESPRAPLKGGLLSGLGMTGALLTKGLLVPGCAALAALCIGFLPSLRPQNYRSYVLITGSVFVCLGSLWPFLLWQKNPDYIYVWLWLNNFARFLGQSDLGPKSPGLFFYPQTLLWFTFPLWGFWGYGLWKQYKERQALLPSPALYFPLPHFLSLGGASERVCLFVMIGLSVLMVSQDARELYLLPFSSSLALLTVPFYETCEKSFFSSERGKIFLRSMTRGLHALFILIILSAFGITLCLQIFPQRVSFLHSYLSPFSFSLSLFLPLSMGGIFLADLLRKRLFPCFLWQWTGYLTLTFCVAVTILLPSLDESKSYRGVMTSLAAHIPSSSRCIGSLGLGEPQRALFSYFTSFPQSRSEVSPSVLQKCDVLIVQEHKASSSKEPALPFFIRKGEWSLRWTGARPYDTRERYTMYLKKVSSGNQAEKQKEQK